MVKVLVCGGRYFGDKEAVFRELDAIRSRHESMVLIQGGASGADGIAREWCQLRKISFITVDADWDRHGRAAGPIRNREMLVLEPDLVLAFKGGRGTADMVRQAEAAGVKIIEAGDR